MPKSPQPSSQFAPDQNVPADIKTEALVQSLRRKEGNWVSWGQTCQQLQKAGYSPQAIFEETGFEPIHQNQIIVGAQVYATLVEAEASEALLTYFETKGSDILYELRILNQAERVSAGNLVLEKRLDTAETRDIAKAIKDFSRLKNPPPEFTQTPGDIVAYRYWKLARQQADLQERSRLIALGLRFAHSETTRQAIEALLTDFTVTQEQVAPPLPIYRLESEDELPRLLPCLGKLPLPQGVLASVPRLEATGPFQQIHSPQAITWVAIPGWQVILKAEDPVSVLCDSEGLASPLPDNLKEEVLLVVDRAQCEWDIHSYFMVASNAQLEIQWFEQAPTCPLLGRVVLVLRPKKILDENYAKELWQIDE